MNGVEFAVALSPLGETAKIQGIVKRMHFVDFAKVTMVTGNKVNLVRESATFTNVEVMSLGCQGYSINLVPKIGDFVMLFSSRTCIKDLGTLQQDTSVDSYSAATYKCIPICSNTAATSFITIDEKGFTFKDASANTIVIDTAGIKVTDMSANDITMNADGITVTDVNANTAVLNADGIEVTDLNANDITMNADGTKVTDVNGNTVTLSADGISLADAAGNSLETTSSAVNITAANGCKIAMGSSGTVINGKLTVNV